jgi:hypothetical protein
MPAPATLAPVPAPQTHPCARCGAPVALDVGLCERCNPLGLKDSASSQVHGTVFIAVGLAVAALAVAGHIAVSNIGPFAARVTAIRPGSPNAGSIATLEVRNEGGAAGIATCRLTDPTDRGLLDSAIVYSPRIEPGATITFDGVVTFAVRGSTVNVTCSGP